MIISITENDKQRISVNYSIYAVLLFIGFILSTGVLAQAPILPEGTPIIEQPFSNDPDKFTFAIIGDKTGGGLDKWHIFDRAIDEINILKPDFAIMVGDLIQGDTTSVERLDEEWKEFWEHQSDLVIPFFPLPGNHDITNRVMYDYWKRNIGRTYSAFTYKDCLFLMLNTEEWHAVDDEWTNWFGEEQIEYVKSQLTQHANVRHTFVLLHRPLWLQKDSGWELIDTALGEREYTVFAGHYHNLTLHTRNDRRYFVLGATGGGFTPKEVREIGSFDHYSLVTVDNKDINIAIIEPGNIHPADISIPEFKAKVSKQLTFKHNFNFDRTKKINSGSIVIDMQNSLEKILLTEIAFDSNDSWQITPNTLSIQVKPGQSTQAIVNLSVKSDDITPFPIYRYSMQYGGELLSSGTKLVHPIDREHMKIIKNWMLLGPFDLGLTSIPSNSNDIPNNFLSITLPDYNLQDLYQGRMGEISWIEHQSESDNVQLRKLFGEDEFTYGYGRSYIKSPENQVVFAQIKWGGNLGKIYVNGKEVDGAGIPNKNLYSWWVHFQLPLQKGWNSITILSADYNGYWDYRMEIADPTDSLKFSTKPNIQ
ncbi:metallophosphoesterase [Candidatus Poribacteria bacterium]|nr:metallophosphoesterase [Candidatus Poribacteria bacterium]